MTTSQTWSYTISINDTNVPDMVLHVKQKSMPMSQMWYYTITHIENPMS
ncbi:hypothetical protein F383_35475 [Gossypium arboreum]|uniref:Uncharacterized protein n=2 Tax=Gossypium arboreum TaxID=29729 RepID=A0A0B0N297_GOSAR|nr:hypothetical protein F383_35475 [Gossypium arboreum]